MPDVVTKRYENRQPGYRHAYTVEYRRRSDGTYKIIVPDCPGDPHGKSAVTHHRYADGEICVTAGKEPRSLEMAEAIAHYWMSGYSTYVRTGTFPDRGAKVNV